MIIAVKKCIIRGKQFRSRSRLTSRSGPTFQVRPDIGQNVMLRSSADDKGGQNICCYHINKYLLPDNNLALNVFFFFPIQSQSIYFSQIGTFPRERELE